MSQVDITTFGYLHDPPPAADITLDLRAAFKDPHTDPRVRDLAGDDQLVRAQVLATPGIPAAVNAVAGLAAAYLSGPGVGPVRVAIGCADGRHRAAVVGMLLAQALAAQALPYLLTHRDIDKPVVDRAAAGEGANE